jgi:hypothetical protein
MTPQAIASAERAEFIARLRCSRQISHRQHDLDIRSQQADAGGRLGCLALQSAGRGLGSPCVCPAPISEGRARLRLETIATRFSVRFPGRVELPICNPGTSLWPRRPLSCAWSRQFACRPTSYRSQLDGGRVEAGRPRRLCAGLRHGPAVPAGCYCRTDSAASGGTGGCEPSPWESSRLRYTSSTWSAPVSSRTRRTAALDTTTRSCAPAAVAWW